MDKVIQIPIIPQLDQEFRVPSDQLLYLAEVHIQGKVHIGHLKSFKWRQQHLTHEPRAVVHVSQAGNSNYITVDIGQITSLWTVPTKACTANNIESFVNNLEETAQQALDQELPVGMVDLVMTQLYDSYRGRGRKQSALTKKQIQSIAQGDERVEQLLRRSMIDPRIVTSKDASDSLFRKFITPNHRVAGALALDQEAKLGGKFKRIPSMFLTTSKDLTSLFMLNGGWQAVDLAVKSGAEGRKLVERATLDIDTIATEADQIVLRRLECLAMGETSQSDTMLEIDVRAALQALDLPMTPAGARQALIKLGQWSDDNHLQKNQVEPWSRAVLEAAASFVDYMLAQRAHLKENVQDLVDLTRIPCICIDGPRTSFRDDALGLRPRTSTGRAVFEQGGKWEILVHITDVTDVYCSDLTVYHGSNNLNEQTRQKLNEAALMRAVSRYDLPGGPLHLMPPTVLRALSFPKDGPNKCLTFWAYLDQNMGSILDCGVERTLVAAPIILTYDEATELLHKEESCVTNNRSAREVARAMLKILDPALHVWSKQRLESSEVSRKRSQRMQTRKLVAESSFQNINSFELTPGHALVDRALDLYSHGISQLLKQFKAPIPSASGAGHSSQGARVGTAPLRRYVDGVTQRQILAVLCQIGKPLTAKECSDINQVATKARNALQKHRSVKNKQAASNITQQQQNALQQLERQLTKRASSNKVVPAVATGHENQVLIKGVGVLATCRGVQGTLEPGKQVLVEITKLDPLKGSIRVKLAQG